jgi:hypothetical protein
MLTVLARGDGGPNSSRPVTSRPAGTAQISLWTALLTPAHGQLQF